MKPIDWRRMRRSWRRLRILCYVVLFWSAAVAAVAVYLITHRPAGTWTWWCDAGLVLVNILIAAALCRTLARIRRMEKRPGPF